MKLDHLRSLRTYTYIKMLESIWYGLRKLYDFIGVDVSIANDAIQMFAMSDDSFYIFLTAKVA